MNEWINPPLFSAAQHSRHPAQIWAERTQVSPCRTQLPYNSPKTLNMPGCIVEWLHVAQGEEGPNHSVLGKQGWSYSLAGKRVKGWGKGAGGRVDWAASGEQLKHQLPIAWRCSTKFGQLYFTSTAFSLTPSTSALSTVNWQLREWMGKRYGEKGEAYSGDYEGLEWVA